ncbi:AP-1-like transcription factor [Penicillium chrysogenum]|uniref:AP-1-like transcription factor n=1 Tax=Penicillium chrysogenum TaxID=5076 RepID=A0A167V7J4_PENCH|nr:AP-1-like transcription factor [Penicillium chrysogenum]
MDNYDQLHQEGIHPSPCQQDLLLAALSSTPSQKSKDGLYQANFEQGNNEFDEKQKSTDGTVKIHNKGTKKKQGESRAKIRDKKPLDSESMTKRRAQNRAAQRACRERKEKHSRDLETRAEELKKSFDVTTQENSLLWAQIKQLQVEIRESRKRL